jgi:hypothetical protein
VEVTKKLVADEVDGPSREGAYVHGAHTTPPMPCHAMPCPALPCPALPCPALPCPDGRQYITCCAYYWQCTCGCGCVCVCVYQLPVFQHPSLLALPAGLMIEGCRWDDKAGALAESYPKELFAAMPVMLIKAVTVEKADQKET